MLITQRERVFKQLNDSQRRYIEFLSRPSQMQKRINDFCDSYNRFSAEFPQLWTNPQTKTELLNRVEILSNQLWAEIQERKDQSVAEREKLIEGGWAHVEKVRVCSFIANLLENEIQKFQVIVAIVTGSLLNEETDLPELVRRLAEKDVSSFENDGGKRSSPLLNEVILAASAHITTVLSENYMLNLDRQAVEMLQTEKDNLNLRVNSLKTYALLLLDEITFYSNQVFDVLDDWIVVAVEQENLVS